MGRVSHLHRTVIAFSTAESIVASFIPQALCFINAVIVEVESAQNRLSGFATQKLANSFPANKRKCKKRICMRIWRMGLLRKVTLSIMALVLLPIVGVCAWLFIYTGDLPDFDHLSQFAPSAQSVVLDSCLSGPSNAVTFDEIGKPLRDALAAAEPARPFPAASLPDRIAVTLLCDRREGEGKRHVNEFRLRWHIRRRFSEKQLFTVYANRAYFGPGATGVEAASQQIFHKATDTLSTEEAAMIAGLLRAPAYYSPYKHPERALERRNRVLENMAAQGSLSVAEAARAEATPLGVVGHLSEKEKSLLPHMPD
jgi:hypothetical protein